MAGNGTVDVTITVDYGTHLFGDPGAIKQAGQKFRAMHRDKPLSMGMVGHSEGGRVFPEWNPAKHVAPQSLRGDALLWVFCDEVERETEGERLARFFATSAHEGHETVRYERPVVPRPDDREWLLPDDNGRVVALFSRALCAVRGDWCAPMDHHWGSAVHSGWVYADDTHNPFLGVPDAIIDEVRGTLRSWTAMRAGQ